MQFSALLALQVCSSVLFVWSLYIFSHRISPNPWPGQPLWCQSISGFVLHSGFLFRYSWSRPSLNHHQIRYSHASFWNHHTAVFYPFPNGYHRLSHRLKTSPGSDGNDPYPSGYAHFRGDCLRSRFTLAFISDASNLDKRQVRALDYSKIYRGFGYCLCVCLWVPSPA